jgi:hypothetical protein
VVAAARRVRAELGGGGFELIVTVEQARADANGRHAAHVELPRVCGRSPELPLDDAQVAVRIVRNPSSGHPSGQTTGGSP